MLIIPAIDLQNGQCVRLRQGQFDAVSSYDASPIDLAKHYAAQGAKRLHLVDLDGAKQGTMQQLPLIQAIQAACNLPVQVGGGIRSLKQVQNCLAAGIQTLVIGSVAVTNPVLMSQIIHQVPVENLVLALDVSLDGAIPRLATHGWQTPTQQSLWDVVQRYQIQGIRHVLCTDIASDGMMSGPNVALYAEAIQRFPAIQWQGSGGIRHTDDLLKLTLLGVSAAILGRMLYESDFDLAAYLAREV